MIDILQTNEGDVNLSTGDIVRTEATEQHKRDLLIAGPGDFKENPLSGVSCFDYLNDDDPADLLRNIRIQFEKDGMRVKALTQSAAGELLIDAEYENDNR